MIFPESYDTALFAPQNRSIGQFSAYIATEEVANETIEMTENPVQHGSAVTDHAYIKPTELTLEIAFPADSSVTLQELYSQFISAQRSFELMDVVTGKHSYHNMLIQQLTCRTDSKTENILSLTIVMKEVIYVQSKEVLVMNNQIKNGSTSNAGRKTMKKAGTDQSALFKLFGG